VNPKIQPTITVDNADVLTFNSGGEIVIEINCTGW